MEVKLKVDMEVEIVEVEVVELVEVVEVVEVEVLWLLRWLRWLRLRCCGVRAPVATRSAPGLALDRGSGP